MDKVIVRNMLKEKHFTAGDRCELAEVLHPRNLALPYSSYSLAHAHIEAGGRTLPHRLVKSSETYVILSGKAVLHIDGESIVLEAGSCVAVPPGAEQFVVNGEEERLEFLCIVTPPWSAGDEEVFYTKA
ncbi:MAG: cupin domain-containing protein [bacterium]|nr:cupin domain-containing protein [bacterium]